MAQKCLLRNQGNIEKMTKNNVRKRRLLIFIICVFNKIMKIKNGDGIMKKENLNENNKDICFSELGFPQYDELVFENNSEDKNFKKSMIIYSEYMKSIDQNIFNDKSRDRRIPVKLDKAIEFSKYNVEAKIARINYMIAPEYYKLELLCELKNEVKEFSDVKFSTGINEINLFHYEVCEYIAKYLFNNEMYKNVINLIDDEFENISFADEFYTELLFFKLASYLYIGELGEFFDLLNDAVNNDLRLDEFILISRLFFNLVQCDHNKSKGYFKELMYENDSVLDYLNRVMIDDKIIGICTTDEKWEIRYLDYCFSFYKGMLNNKYFFDSLYTMVEDENSIMELEAEYEENPIALMKEDNAFIGLDEEELEILADSKYKTKYSFYFSTRWEVLEETGITMSTIMKLEKNGVEFYDDEVL